MITWNNRLKLVLSDVDETVADLYRPAEYGMVCELTRLLESGIKIFFITGQGVNNVHQRVVSQLPVKFWPRILIGHCSGAEVWGYGPDFKLLDHPYYSLYEKNTTLHQRMLWRDLVNQLTSEFGLKVFPVMPVKEFLQECGENPLAIMLEDRGPQITLEVVNGHNLTAEQTDLLGIDVPMENGVRDLRLPICRRADELFARAGLPITSRLGGEFAVDFAIEGASKKTAVMFVLNNPTILSGFGLSIDELRDPMSLEIWGDKFSISRGGTDRHMSEAVDSRVRSIDFRHEDPEELPRDLNIYIWKGKRQLHHGLLEYLESRSNSMLEPPPVVVLQH